MVASFTTSCASSQRKPATKIGASALVMGALALAACSGGKGDDSKGSNVPAPSIIPNLAVMGSAPQAAKAEMSRVIDASPSELQAMIETGKVRLIDIRTDAEVAQSMIPGAEHSAMDRFDPASLDDSDGRTVVLYCRSGRRSRIVGERLAAHTGEPAIHLEGGILAWEAAGQKATKP